jgi:hypothetical protein
MGIGKLRIFHHRRTDMTRNVYFSFQYIDVWKVNQIRYLPNIIGIAPAGFDDASEWEELKRFFGSDGGSMP